MDCGDERIYRKVGFARSLLAHELTDGELKLILTFLCASAYPTKKIRWVSDRLAQTLV